jgi:hypothetical protein
MRRTDLRGGGSSDGVPVHRLYGERRECAVNSRMAMAERFLDDRVGFAMIVVDRSVRFACRGGIGGMGFSSLRGQGECEKRAKKYRAHQDNRLGYESCVAQKMPFSFWSSRM